MNPARILIVEDDLIVARDIAQQLARMGHHVVGSTARGDDALVLALETEPNLILMDIQLEGETDGIAAAERIQKRLGVPIVYLTAFADSRTVQRAAATEPFGYLIKPFEDSQLRTAIEVARYKHAAEKKLRESERRYAVTLSSIGDAVIATDAEARVTFMNAIASSLTGWSETDAVGRPLPDVFRIVDEDTRATVEDPAAKVLRLGAIVGLSSKTTLLAKNGREIAIDDSGAPIVDDHGKLIGVVLVFRDVTGRRLLERAEHLRQAKETAEAANRAKDEFLANVSHEIRTPMNAIVGMTDLVLETPLRDDQRRSLKSVQSAAGSLLAIIDDLLDFSKIEAGKFELDPSAFSLRELLGDLTRALSPRALQKGLTLTCTVDPEVPALVIGDAGRLRQVLVNLTGNAIKFTPKGTVSVRAARGETARSHGVAVRFVVQDTGIGIPRNKLASIFRAFEQEDMTTTRNYGGTGLGLTIAARIVSMMGGDIAVESKVNRGSTFTFTTHFGARGADPVIDGEAPRPSLERAIPAASDALRVLVAEDHPLNLELLYRLLLTRGHVVRTARNGREALDLMHREAFDLLLLDIHMPEIDGFSVVESVRDRERTEGGHLPVIALTARSRAEDRARGLAAGMDELLVKPIDARSLWDAIDRVCDRSSTRTHGGATDVAVERAASRRAPAGLLSPRVLLNACGEDAGILRVLCETLRLTLPKSIDGLKSALDDDDAPRLCEAAHALRGTVSVFSTHAGSLLSDIEDHAASGELAAARALFGKLPALASELVRETGGVSIESLLNDSRR
jgi:PAS domain S-box-containing protein